MHAGSAIRSVLLLLAALVVLPLAQARAGQIDWQVEHRFRLFKYQSDFELHRIAYDYVQRVSAADFATDPILAMEHVLNDPAWLAIITGSAPANLLPSDRARHEALLLDDHLAMEARAWRRKRGGDTTALPRFGWAAQSLNRTCWDEIRQTYKGCARQFEGTQAPLDPDYLSPRRHLITARIAEAHVPADANCRWRADKPVFRSGRSESILAQTSLDAPCRGVELFVAFGATVRLEAELPDGTRLDTTIGVEDLLIVSLGDSFASGEGNPDLPVQMGTAAFFTAAFFAAGFFAAAFAAGFDAFLAITSLKRAVFEKTE